MTDNQPSAQPIALVIEVVDNKGIRHSTAWDSELAKKYGPAPEEPKVVSSEADMDPQGEDRDPDGVDAGSGNRKPKAK